jgi:hypothetical protein
MGLSKYLKKLQASWWSSAGTQVFSLSGEQGKMDNDEPHLKAEPPILAIPAELLLAIAEFLGKNDIVAFSETCSDAHAACCPLMFEHVEVRSFDADLLPASILPFAR